MVTATPVRARVSNSQPRHTTRHLLLARAIVAFAAATLLALVSLWLADGGVASLTGPGGLATGLGRLTGLIAADLLLVQVALMARIPPVEQAWGQGALTRVHRVVGHTSLYMMLAHIVLIVTGYTQAGRLSLPAQVWALVADYPGMLLAVGGTIALIAVVVTSIRAVRRRWRYESWHLIHLYAYVGVGLVLPHELWTGADFLSSPGMTLFWWITWGLTAAALVTFRLLLPLARSLVHRLVVDSVRVEAPNTLSIVLRGRHMDWLRPRPGQYFQWRFLTGPGWTRGHPYSVSAVPGGRRLRITLRTDGDEGRRLSRVRPGTKVLIEGPYGTLTAERRQHRDVLLLAAGLGITPIRGLAEQIATERATAGRGGRHRPSVIVLHRISRPGGAVFGAEWHELEARYGVIARTLLGPRGTPGSWLPALPAGMSEKQYLRWAVADIADRDVYLCGPPEWMAAARRTLTALGVGRASIHAERFEY